MQIASALISRIVVTTEDQEEGTFIRNAKLIKDIDLNIVSKKEITKSVAPSLDIEQKFYNVVGVGIDKVQQGLVQAILGK